MYLPSPGTLDPCKGVNISGPFPAQGPSNWIFPCILGKPTFSERSKLSLHPGQISFWCHKDFTPAPRRGGGTRDQTEVKTLADNSQALDQYYKQVGANEKSKASWGTYVVSPNFQPALSCSHTVCILQGVIPQVLQGILRVFP